MRFTLKDVWQAFLSYLVFKFEFATKEVEDPLLSLLRLELENARIRERQLLEIIANSNSKALETPVEDTPSEMKPVGREPWYVTARRKTQESIERRKQIERDMEESKARDAAKVTAKVNIQSTEDLERELAIGAD
jgi:hypothetical protein